MAAPGCRAELTILLPQTEVSRSGHRVEFRPLSGPELRPLCRFREGRSSGLLRCGARCQLPPEDPRWFLTWARPPHDHGEAHPISWRPLGLMHENSARVLVARTSLW